jgi:WS/DGAT/MGAT family acyltransferase
MYVIEGLDGVEALPPGSFAILTKIHHAAVDGVTGAEITTAIHDLEVDAQPLPSKEPWKPEAEPTVVELALRTAVNNVRQPFRFAGVLGQLAPPAIRALWEHQSGPADPDSDEVPRTRFNNTVSQHRVFEARTFALDQVKQIRKRVDGATVNDVVLAVCSGALRRYLGAKDELPRKSLTAFAPISVRTQDEQGTAGNQVSGMLVNLSTQEPDPLKRLERVHETTLGSKQLSAAVGARSLTDLTQFMPGALAGISGRLVARTGLMSRLNPVANTVITNVPGPQVPLYFSKARMLATFGLGLPLDGLGLFHAIFSYNGTITISITACRDQVPDPGFYSECLQASFDELLQAAVN